MPLKMPKLTYLAVKNILSNYNGMTAQGRRHGFESGGYKKFFLPQLFVHWGEHMENKL